MIPPTGLLVIGDGWLQGQPVDPSFRRLVWHLQRNKRSSRELAVASYDELLAGALPDIKAPEITIALFFPFSFWDAHIEVYWSDSRVYGDGTFGQAFHGFMLQVEQSLRWRYRGKKIIFMNPPKVSILERDKQAAKRFFQTHGIPTPSTFHPTSHAAVERLLKQGKALYIKPRFGAMGKGITYLSSETMMTNFAFREGKLISRKYDYNWKVVRVRPARRKRLLNLLMAGDFVWEEAVDSPSYNGRRFDFRVYCLYGKIPYLYARSTPVNSLVTNWSQGGRIDKKKRFSRYVPAKQLKRVERLALRVARKLDLRYAGVDVIFSKDYKKIYCLEAHSFPGYERGFPLMKSLAQKV